MADEKPETDYSWRERKRIELRERLKLGEPTGTRVSHLDGLPFTEDEEARINAVFHSLFKGRNGKLAMEYLARLTVEYIGGPGITPDALMHMEGGRYIYGIIQARTELGRKH